MFAFKVEGKSNKLLGNNTYRIINTATGKHLCTVISDGAMSDEEVLKVASDGMYDKECEEYEIFGFTYYIGHLAVTAKDIETMLPCEKISLLKDNGLSTYDAERYVNNDMIQIYDDSILGFNEYKSNMNDEDIQHEWHDLHKVARYDDLGNLIGNYRIEFLIRESE